MSYLLLIMVLCCIRSHLCGYNNQTMSRSYHMKSSSYYEGFVIQLQTKHPTAREYSCYDHCSIISNSAINQGIKYLRVIISMNEGNSTLSLPRYSSLCSAGLSHDFLLYLYLEVKEKYKQK